MENSYAYDSTKGVRSGNTRWGWDNNYSISYNYVTESTTREIWHSNYTLLPIVEGEGNFPQGSFNKIREAFDSWSRVSNILFFETDDPEADVLIGYNDLNSKTKFGIRLRVDTLIGGGQFAHGIILLDSNTNWSTRKETGFV